MAELLQEYASTVTDAYGITYSVSSYGEQRSDGTWIGWLQFYPIEAGNPVLLTDQETSQPNRTAVEYWATGLEPIYFEGALERARAATLGASG